MDEISYGLIGDLLEVIPPATELLKICSTFPVCDGVTAHALQCVVGVVVVSVEHPI